MKQLADLAERVAEALARRTALDSAVRSRLEATAAQLHAEHCAAGPGADAGSDAHTDAGLDVRLAGLAVAFGLHETDTNLLLVAAAPDLDANFALAFGLLRGGEVPGRASVSLALELCGLSTLAPDGFIHLGASAPLRQHLLIDVVGSAPWLLRELEVPDRVLAHLVGADEIDPVLAAALIPSVPMRFDETEPLVRALIAGQPLAWVRSTAGAAGLSLAAGALAALDIGRLTLDVRRAPPAQARALLAVAVREAALRGMGVIATGAERLGEPELVGTFTLLEAAPTPTLLVGARQWDPLWLPRHPLTVDAPMLAPAQRAAAWQDITGGTAPEGFSALRLTPEASAQVAGYARTLATAAGSDVSDDHVLRAARVVGGSHTVGKRPTIGFDDVVLPEYQSQQLRRIVSWVRHRDDVLARSGMFADDRKGSGIAALFSGSPGTGKTLSASVIAGELGLDLFAVNLSEIVDKYIGETEKNLERVFSEAESLNVILFFDEADALFGKRSEVKDAHDRYANQEVAYLLQRVENFDGVTILSTNLRGNVDPAFSRRLQFMIHFPDPDVPTRRRLWQLYLGKLDFLERSEPIDVGHLAEVLELAGGDIKNVVLAAVYDATAAGERLGMRHLLAAAVNEYQKLGRRVPSDGFRPATAG